MSDAPPPVSSIEPEADVVLIHDSATLARELPTADILLVWDYRFSDLDAMLPTATRLKWVHAASVGVEPLLTPNLLSAGITLTNSRGVFDRAIAEYVLAGYLAFLKDLPRTLKNSESRRWEHRITKKLAGRKALVVGTGSIGREISRILQAVNVDVTLLGRKPVADAEFGDLRSFTELDQLVPDADLLVLAAPLTAESKFMVDQSVIDAMHPGLYLVNVGRGDLIDEPAFVRALSGKRLAGATLDVFSTEPLSKESPLWENADVIVSPHMSADFDGFDDDLISVFRDNLRRWRRGDVMESIVDQNLGYVPSNA